jgi:hypothetical protein
MSSSVRGSYAHTRPQRLIIRSSVLRIVLTLPRSPTTFRRQAGGMELPRDHVSMVQDKHQIQTGDSRLVQIRQPWKQIQARARPLL